MAIYAGDMIKMARRGQLPVSHRQMETKGGEDIKRQRPDQQLFTQVRQKNVLIFCVILLRQTGQSVNWSAHEEQETR